MRCPSSKSHLQAAFFEESVVSDIVTSSIIKQFVPDSNVAESHHIDITSLCNFFCVYWFQSLLSPLIHSEVRGCLKLDPDHKQCYSHYKQVKKLNKQIQSAEELIQEQRWVCVCSDNCISL